MILAALAALCACQLQAQQIYNLDFDTWSRTSGTWYLYEKDAPDSHRVWDSTNRGLSILGINTVTPEYEHVAVPGAGKAAARVESRNVLWVFVAGHFFNGSFNGVVDMSGADLDFGIPFTGCPRSLSGYVHYIPKPVNFAREPYLHMKGKLDEGRIEVLLTDWDGPYHIVTGKERFIDLDTDPHIIGRASMVLNEDTGGYIRFEIPFIYRSGKTPRYATVVVTSSWYGSDFTGGSGSIIYADEFRFNY